MFPIRGIGFAASFVVVGVLASVAPAESDGFSCEEHSDRLLILRSGRPIAEYAYRDAKTLRPYFTALRTTEGVQVTRNHPPIAGTDATDHDTMHPGLWFGFGDLGGHDFWRNKGTIEHVRFVELPRDGADRLTFSTESRLLTADGRPLCRMVGQVEFRGCPEGWMLIWEATFHADGREIVFGDQEEMGFGVRVATPLTEKNGGRITGATGRATAADTWGQPAPWCDYSGTVDGQRVGVTLMADPKNFREPWWHNRDYGLMVANPFGRAAMKQGEPSRIPIKGGETLRLRFGAFVHGPLAADPQAAFAAFCRREGS